MSHEPAERQLSTHDPQVVDADVLIVGAGVAGLVAALDVLQLAPSAQVVILDKGEIAVRGGSPGRGGGSTPLAQGGLAAAVGAGDSPQLHAEDTIRAGDGLSDPRAVAIATAEGPARVADLMRWGAVFDREAADSSALALATEAGQSVARSVRAADATGAEIARALRAAARGRVTRLQGVAAALVTAGVEGRVVGAHAVLDATGSDDVGSRQPNGPVRISARATVLATGGCGGLYAATTNPDGATADGIALAYAAGAALSDMEFIQFHPTGLKPSTGGGFQRFLLTEALRGAGATLVDRSGNRFMVGLHPDAELAPRYVVTKAILDQSGGVWLDATAITEPQLRSEFPTVLGGAARAGYDLGADLVPVEPVQHYMIGGVATDLHGRTSVPGLWAAGEVACTGVHGANRMAGNSLLQACVFGHRAARDVIEELRRPGAEPDDPVQPALDDPHSRRTPTPMVDSAGLRSELRRSMSRGAGAIRTAEGLQATAGTLARLRDTIGRGPFDERALIELDSAITVATLIVESASLRTESRGVHWRDDHPTRDRLWDARHVRIAGSPLHAGAVAVSDRSAPGSSVGISPG